ncbi:hypothetical protein [Atopococcus tabaci]|uniref:hypothetical protein n=1 Tax=Atopococcus tabaci TaxID=269774 RepID=UPI000405511E|nr:hypothetical protein [Atopococcus tabaci]
MRKAKWLKVGILSLTSVMFLAACGDNTETPPADEPTVEQPEEDPMMDDTSDMPMDEDTSVNMPGTNPGGGDENPVNEDG